MDQYNSYVLNLCKTRITDWARKHRVSSSMGNNLPIMPSLKIMSILIPKYMPPIPEWFNHSCPFRKIFYSYISICCTTLHDDWTFSACMHTTIIEDLATVNHECSLLIGYSIGETIYFQNQSHRNLLHVLAFNVQYLEIPNLRDFSAWYIKSMSLNSRNRLITYTRALKSNMVLWR